MTTTSAAPPRDVLDDLVEHSLAVITDGQAPSGAYIASPTFPTYHYSWFRDGAFIADAMSRHGHVASAAAFHQWCDRVIADRAEQVTDLVARAGTDSHPGPDEHLRTRYTLDGDDADGFWQNFQLDGYGTWLWAMAGHARRHPTSEPPVDHVELVVDYLAAYWDEPCYDWWEEHLQHRHVSTLGAVWAGLDAAADWAAVDRSTREHAADVADKIRDRIATDGVVDGSLVKWLGSTAVDASLVACLTPFDLYPPDHPVATTTISRIEDELAPAGVYRYLDDVYYGGGQWILLAAFLAWHHARAGDTERAGELLAWITDQADTDGNLPEQVATDLLAPDHLDEWEQGWGPSASPLLWSHAMVLSVVAELDQTQADKVDHGE